MSDPDAVNYQPLIAMRHAWWTVCRATIKDWRGLGAILLALATPVAGVLAGTSLLIIVGPIIYLALLVQRVVQYKNKVWEQFAAVNGWSLDLTTTLDELVPPSMQFGHSPAFSPIIQAQLGSLTGDLFTYNTTVGSGRYQHTYYFTVARLPLPIPLPHMLLLSKKSGVDLQRDLSNRQDLQLEGDFNDYFKLQIEQGQQVDALTVITPDVMQTLLQYNRAEDIEIFGNDLYFILNLDRRNLRDMEQLLQSVVALGDQITQNTALERVPASQV